MNKINEDTKCSRGTIILLNKYLCSRYKNASNIKHYQGQNQDETHLTTFQMPNTNKEGRIFAGYTNDLIEQIIIEIAISEFP